MCKILILGGGGPLASAKFHFDLVLELNKKGCELDEEYPEIVHLSRPFGNLNIEGRHNNIELYKEICTIPNINLYDHIVVPCNSICYSLVYELKIPNVLDIISFTVDNVLDRIKNIASPKILLLASSFILNTKIYQKLLLDSRPDIEFITLSERDSNYYIAELLKSSTSRCYVNTLIRNLYFDLDLLIYGCTEYGLNYKEYDNLVVDSSTILIDNICKRILI